VVYKQRPSGSFGANMASNPTPPGCDGVVVTGTTTMGRLRATVIDAFSLCDLNARYADVVGSREALEYFSTIPKGTFDLPPGMMPQLARPAGF
jgi:hypothetical protein